MPEDLPEPKQLMKALAEREAMLRSLFDNPLAAIVVTDEEGRVRSASAAALELLGVNLEELLGRRFDDLVAEVGPPDPRGVQTLEVLRPDDERLRVRRASERLPDGLHVAVLRAEAPPRANAAR